MITRAFVLAVVLPMAGVCTHAADLSAQTRLSAAAIDSARRIVEGVVARERLPGFAISVSHGNGKDVVEWHEGFGSADAGAKTPATSDTRFRVGSIVKLMTATALVRLSDAGTVSLDAPIARYMPDLPIHLQAITLRQLAGHLGGIRHYRYNDFLSTTHYETMGEAITIFAKDSLIASPGSKYSYTSYGYNLIGAVLERRTGKLFPALLQEQVLDPLGMRATVPDRKGRTIPNRARTYSISPGAIADAPDDDLSGRWPSGGYLSSTADLGRFGRSLLDTNLLGAASRTMMLTPQRLPSGEPIIVGLGWRISRDSAQRTFVHHGGTSNGGRAMLLVYPEQQLVVAMATNATAQWNEKLALDIAAIFLKTEPVLTPPGPRSSTTPALPLHQ